MTEASWDDQDKNPAIDWRMSAALQDVPRGGGDLPEVTSLEGAVRAWTTLDPQHRAAATLTPERPLLIEGTAHDSFQGEGIATLVSLLPANTRAPAP